MEGTSQLASFNAQLTVVWKGSSPVTHQAAIELPSFTLYNVGNKWLRLHQRVFCPYSMSHPIYQFAQNLIEEYHDEVRPILVLPPHVTAGRPFFEGPQAGEELEGEEELEADGGDQSRLSIGDVQLLPFRRRRVPRVGIIGAGVGGLFAAMLLQECKIRFDILESSDRIGGRLYTWRFDEKQDPYAHYVRPLSSPTYFYL